MLKVPYVCGPLTELPPPIMDEVKRLYSRIGDLCQRVNGARAFVPHEHYDPILHADFTPTQVDAAERNQVCNNTTLLIVMAIAPSWGGGIEVEMAHRSRMPVIVLFPKGKKVSRLLRGNPAVAEVIEYENEEDALQKLESWVDLGFRRQFDDVGCGGLINHP